MVIINQASHLFRPVNYSETNLSCHASTKYHSFSPFASHRSRNRPHQQLAIRASFTCFCHLSRPSLDDVLSNCVSSILARGVPKIISRQYRRRRRRNKKKCSKEGSNRSKSKSHGRSRGGGREAANFIDETGIVVLILVDSR